MPAFSWNPSNWIASALVLFSPAAPAADAGKPAVVLLHGIYDTGAKMGWLARRFQQAGYETFCPTLTPANGTISLKDSAKLLDETVMTRFGKDRALHVVGFSMGGLISRYWVAHFPVRQRVRSFATISSPHRGTWMAGFLSHPGILEMRAGSEFLRELAERDAVFVGLHPLSIYTPLDLMIVPADSSKWAAAENVTHWSALHPLMVMSPQVADRLLRNMVEAEKL